MARDLQYGRRGARRRVVVGARGGKGRLARSVLTTELAIDQNRAVDTTSACRPCRWFPGSRCAGRVLRVDRVQRQLPTWVFGLPPG
jgi:hypothetical protein